MAITIKNKLMVIFQLDSNRFIFFSCFAILGPCISKLPFHFIFLSGQQEQTSNANDKSSKVYEDKVEYNPSVMSRHGQNGQHHATNGNNRNREEFTQSRKNNNMIFIGVIKMN